MLAISGFCRVSLSLERNKAVKKLELEVQSTKKTVINEETSTVEVK